MAHQRTSFWRRLRGINPLNSPRHYALGIVVGIAIGLIPKFSIIPWAMMLIGMLLPTNLLALIAAGVVFTFVGPLLDAYSHRIGAALLTEESLVSFWQLLFSNEQTIWLQLHNSVVLGSSVIALVLVLPVYLISIAATAYLRPIFTKYLFSNSIADWIRGYPLQTN